MGYTHYWTPNLNQEDFNKVVEDVKEIENHIELYDGVGREKGVVYEDELLMFNGKGDAAHETCAIEVGSDWTFCKTARKPYDVAVMVALLCMMYHNKNAKVSSDGEVNQEWVRGVAKFREIFPDRELFTLSENSEGNFIMNF
jgi:hypothetical protein